MVSRTYADQSQKKLKLQPGPKPSCARFSCRKQFIPGDLCISVEGEYTPPNKDLNGNAFEVKRNFRFCVRKECVSVKPKNSNLVVPPAKIIKSPGNIYFKRDPTNLCTVSRLPLLKC